MNNLIKIKSLIFSSFFYMSRMLCDIYSSNQIVACKFLKIKLKWFGDYYYLEPFVDTERSFRVHTRWIMQENIPALNRITVSSLTDLSN